MKVCEILDISLALDEVVTGLAFWDYLLKHPLVLPLRLVRVGEEFSVGEVLEFESLGKGVGDD